MIVSDDCSVVLLSKKDNDDIESLTINFEEGIVANRNIQKNQILSNEDLIKKEEYMYENRPQNEIISVELNNAENILNSKLKNKDIVNLYFECGNSNEDKEVKLVQSNLKIIEVIEDLSKEKSNYTIIFCVPNTKVAEIKKYKEIGKFSVSLIK